jgi:RNA methyltransferase, TrmH family
VLISSRANPRVREIRSLRDRKERERSGLFLAEGARVLAEALRADAEIETLIVAPDRLSATETALAQEAAGRARGVLELTPAVFDAIAFREDEQQALAAVVRRRPDRLPAEPLGELCWVAVHAIQHPGNLGTLVRICDAVGGAGVILTGASTDPYHPIAVRGSLGAIFSQRIVETTAEEFGDWTRHYPCAVVGTSPGGELDYREARYEPPVVVLLGNERTGLTPEQQALCQQLVRIPMAGVVDSLNLTVAAGLVLYEISRQRG